MSQSENGQTTSSLSSFSSLILRTAQLQLEETVKLACRLSKQRHNRLSKLSTAHSAELSEYVKPTLTVKDLGFAAKNRGLDVLVFDRTASYERKIFDFDKDRNDHLERAAAVKKEMERIDEAAINNGVNGTASGKKKKKKQRVEL